MSGDYQQFFTGKVLARDGLACRYCGVPVFRRPPKSCARYPQCLEALTRDHVIPKSLGGEKVVDNIVIACRRCNDDKGDAPARGVWSLLPVPEVPARQGRRGPCGCAPGNKRRAWISRHEMEAMGCGFDFTT